ncbi:MAG: hypothetical protein OSB41_11465, partial [Kiritimatiellae bacterium]|nr:hypothetical protein [Kiritimatiellia bacterium]
MTLAKVTLLGRAARVAHIDGATFFSIVNKAWGGLVGMVSVVLIAKTLSPVEQGFYYTFSSLLALQVVLELGFSYVIAQVTAHEFALSEQHESTSVRKRAFSRLISVFWLSLKWYGILAIFFAVFCSMSGEIFFHATSSDSPRVWNIPWLLAVMTFALSIPLIPVYSFLEGCNRVSAVAKARTIQDVVAYCALWGMFLLGAGLYAVPALYLAKVLAGISGLILTGQGPFLLSILRADVNTSEAISWRKEIFPFQWKIGLSWLSGYLIFQLISPALFSAQGPKAAGQAGMTIAIFTGFNALMSSWVITKSPYFCQLVALGRSQELRAAFRRAALTSTLISVLGLCTLV